MSDRTYCYPNTDVLKNKVGTHDKNVLFGAECDYSMTRLWQLMENPVNGRFDFNHLKAIHKHVFQDLYDWAGQPRTVDIGKGNLFCMSAYIDSYAQDVFRGFSRECHEKAGDREAFAHAVAEKYGDLNALHPFREGNGRTQREFVRELCLDCGYLFDLSGTSHQEMLDASKESFDTGRCDKLEAIFKKAIKPIPTDMPEYEKLPILSDDDVELANRQLGRRVDMPFGIDLEKEESYEL